MQRRSDPDGSSPPGSAWCRARTPAAARTGWAVSPKWEIAICATCSWSAPPPSSAIRAAKRPLSASGQTGSCSASRPGWSPSPSPTRWPGSSGPSWHGTRFTAAVLQSPSKSRRKDDNQLGQERTRKVMPIGQAGERDNLRDSTRIERDSLMRTRSTDPIMASGLVPRAQAGHMNVPDPIVKTLANPLALRGPSTHESHSRAQRNPLSDPVRPDDALETSLLPETQWLKACWRRGRDSNPRSPARRTTVFETAPFDRSGTSPAERGRGLNTGLRGTSSEQKSVLHPILDPKASLDPKRKTPARWPGLPWRNSLP